MQLANIRQLVSGSGVQKATKIFSHFKPVSTWETARNLNKKDASTFRLLESVYVALNYDLKGEEANSKIKEVLKTNELASWIQDEKFLNIETYLNKKLLDPELLAKIDQHLGTQEDKNSSKTQHTDISRLEMAFKYAHIYPDAADEIIRSLNSTVQVTPGSS